jgi:hypothetical protein
MEIDTIGIGLGKTVSEHTTRTNRIRTLPAGTHNHWHAINQGRLWQEARGYSVTPRVRCRSSNAERTLALADSTAGTTLRQFPSSKRTT